MTSQRYDIVNRQGQIRLSELHRVEQSLGKFGQLIPSGGPFLDTSFGQVSQTVDAAAAASEAFILALIGDNDGLNPRRYTWAEVDRAFLTLKAGGRTGTFNASEINGKEIEPGTLAWLLSDGATGYDFDSDTTASASTAFAESEGFAKTVNGVGYLNADSLLASIQAPATGLYSIAGSAWCGNSPTNAWSGYGAVQLGLYYHTPSLGYVPIGGASLVTGTPGAVLRAGDGPVDITGTYGFWSIRPMAVARSALSASVITSVPATATVQLHFLNDILGLSPTNESTPAPQAVQGILGVTRVG